MVTYEELFEASKKQGFGGTFEEFCVAYNTFQQLKPSTEKQVRGMVQQESLADHMDKTLEIAYKKL